jgi:hypothetical protein
MAKKKHKVRERKRDRSTGQTRHASTQQLHEQIQRQTDTTDCPRACKSDMASIWRVTVFKLNRLLPNRDNIDIGYRHSPERGVAVVVLERPFSCGVMLYVPLIPGVEVIVLPFPDH